MGKIITAPKDIKAEIPTPKGTASLELDFWGFMIAALNAKAPIQDLGAILEAKDLREILKRAEDRKAETITLEDGQHKILHASLKAHVPTMLPLIAMEVVDYIRALEDKTDKNPGGAEKIDLSNKK
jgi:hypothetical protein